MSCDGGLTETVSSGWSHACMSVPGMDDDTAGAAYVKILNETDAK